MRVVGISGMVQTFSDPKFDSASPRPLPLLTAAGAILQVTILGARVRGPYGERMAEGVEEKSVGMANFGSNADECPAEEISVDFCMFFFNRRFFIYGGDLIMLIGYCLA